MTHRIDRLLRRASGDDHGPASQGVCPYEGMGHRLYHNRGVDAPTQFVRAIVVVRHACIADGYPDFLKALHVLHHQRMPKLGGARGARKHRWPVVQQD